MAEPQFLIVPSEVGPKVLIRVQDETIWLSQLQMAELFQKSVPTINEHIQNIFDEGELEADSVIRNFRITASDSKNYDVLHYNLDVVLSVGYRVKSTVGTQFRIWATRKLREFLIKGFVLDDERLKEEATIGDYFDELLERIRDIRSSEKLLYKKVRDICALSLDYDAQDRTSQMFFATVQNKLLYAVCGKTAPELIVGRADHKKSNMGLTSFQGEVVRKKDVSVAKNYLAKDEIEQLNLLVGQFLDFAELRSKQKQATHMGQ